MNYNPDLLKRLLKNFDQLEREIFKKISPEQKAELEALKEEIKNPPGFFEYLEQFNKRHKG